MTNVQIGDIVDCRSQDDGRRRLGIIRRIVERPDETLVQICAPGSGFGRVIEVIESTNDDGAIVPPPKGPFPKIGDRVRYEPHEGAGRHEGNVMCALQLRNGDVLVRVDRVDAPLCRAIEIIGGANNEDL